MTNFLFLGSGVLGSQLPPRGRRRTLLIEYFYITFRTSSNQKMSTVSLDNDVNRSFWRCDTLVYIPSVSVLKFQSSTTYMYVCTSARRQRSRAKKASSSSLLRVTHTLLLCKQLFECHFIRQRHRVLPYDTILSLFVRALFSYDIEALMSSYLVRASIIMMFKTVLILLRIE